ncbi:TetR/AcrR family transcriptional regulator [Ketobacter sp.]|uniref:TetR/AcrR family transcriptional regulator n=1 Tax=Ketobacter sp. TaxID=2083498 RepID=UPI000F21B27F|nr:TetR/AcrR family transcriptional regulator [Ketobacter sp.]RLT96324.1 MAG: TetR/AcrR family transcriptional regulator [Ketobacter sp.]
MKKRPVQQRSRMMVKSIIDAACQVIAEEGLDALTTNRVAELAGISNGSFYQYFYDRADLIEAVLEQVSQDANQMFNRQLGQLDTRQVDVQTLSKMALQMSLAFLRSNALYPELIRNWHRLPIQRLFDPIAQHLASISRTYLLQHVEHYSLDHLHTKLYVLINSTIFTMIRYLHEEDPILKEPQIINCLANMVELVLRDQLPDSP